MPKINKTKGISRREMLASTAAISAGTILNGCASMDVSSSPRNSITIPGIEEPITII